MNSILVLLAGIIIGGGLAAYLLSRRWRQAVQDADKALQDIAQKHQATQHTNRELKQELADTRYQLTQANNALRAAQQQEQQQQ